MSTLKLVVFDMDDTLITDNTWLRFNTALGVTAEDDDRLYHEFSAGQIDYQTWLSELTQLYDLHNRHVTRDFVNEVLDTFELAPGAHEAVRSCKQHNLQTAIITGSFTTTAETVRDALGMDHAIANTSCVYDAEDRLINIASHGEEASAKVIHLESLLQELQIAPESVLVVGDGANDVPLFKLTQHGVTFTSSKPAVRNEAEHIIRDLSEMTPLLNNIKSAP